ncbi:hypothetical protein J2W27_004541 [Variovorax boronicumulans]|uniref:hypothetical protein n=1 Tax=Variovorax boronicumulans TaxID=436515 RepID=UPI002785C438|nr:hypothetical protein [Variovorax boronicumulans]MDP9912415.1 hypothetical protein [Variovorax boronicumulans]
MGDSLAAANGQGSSNVPGPVGATERASIMGMFADGPGSGSNAALDYIANNRWSGMSDTSAPSALGQQYVDTYGGDVTPTAGRAGGISDHDRAVQRSVALANQPESIGSYVSGDQFRVDVTGTDGWVRAETLPDGTQVLKNSDGLRRVEQRSSGGAAPLVPGYEVSGSRTYLAFDGEDIFYSPAPATQDANDTYAGNMDARDIRGSFAYQSLLSRGLADAEASRALEARIASGPSVRGLNAVDVAKAAGDRALLNFLGGQGRMALGGVAASATMLASGDIMGASRATDIAEPIDSLIAPMGGGGRVAAASGQRRTGGPGLVPNAALETERVLQGDASRARIVGEIGKAAQPSIEALLRLDPNAQIGFRGSLAGGLKGEHKIDVNGNRVAFDGDVAFKLNIKTGRYETYTGQQGYDADFFVVSDKLAAQLGNSRRFMDAARLDRDSLVPIFDAFGRSLQSNPALSGMKPGDTTFRVWSQDAINRKRQGGDAQIYFLTGGQR